MSPVHCQTDGQHLLSFFVIGMNLAPNDVIIAMQTASMGEAVRLVSSNGLGKRTRIDEFVDTAKNHPGFIKAMWCGDSACEDKLKDATGGVKSHAPWPYWMPFPYPFSRCSHR